MIANLHSAYSACEENSAKFLDVADPVFKVIDLLIGKGASAVKDQIEQGHEPATYRLWTNSIYYGYRGWYNYNNPENNITRVNWAGRDQKSLVGDECFYGCKGIQFVEGVDELELIGNYAFENCEGLEFIRIPDNTTLEGRAFANCDSLTDIEIGDEVSIGDMAFDDCKSLEEVTIPDKVRYIGAGAFRNCESLTKVSVPCELEYYPSRSVSGGEPFLNCPINHLTITKGRTGELFDYDYSLENAATCAEHVTVAEGVKSLGKSMFNNDLKILDLPSTLERINGTKSNYSRSCEKINYNGDIASWCNIDFNGMEVMSWGNGDFYVKDTLLNDLIVPEGVKRINENAFSYCTSISTVSIPKTLTEVCHDAFNNCSNLKDVYYNDTEEAWDNIRIDYNNDPLTNAARHFKEIPETVPLDDAEITGIENMTYTGKAIIQKVTVKLGDDTLEEGTDYSIEYKDNTNIGTATLIITGTGRYIGTIEKAFKIRGSLSQAATKVSIGSVAAKVYTGSAIKPTPTVNAMGTGGKVVTLVKDTDYTLSYTKNTAIGKAMITIKGSTQTMESSVSNTPFTI